MNIETVKKEEMEALESLAKTNLKVSEAKVILANIKEEEDVYTKEREERVLKKIDKILEESNHILEDAYKNYNDIHNLSKDSSEFVSFLTEAHDSLSEMLEVFESKTDAWEANVKIREDKIEEIKKKILVDRIQIKNDQDSIDARNKEIANERRKIHSDRGALDRAIKRLKENRI